MKVIVILKDGRRFDDVEADEDVVRRGRCEFVVPNVGVSITPPPINVQPAFPRIVFCYNLRIEDGVPVFEER